MLYETFCPFLSLTSKKAAMAFRMDSGGMGEMGLINNKLTDIGQGKGFTTNFQVQYESTLPNQANVIANANDLLTASKWSS